MYSYEDRIRAVKLFIKLGKPVGPAIRQLGYLTKKSLKSWYWEYEQERDLQVSYLRLKQKYSAEQKQVAIQHFFEPDRCIASTLKALGYPSLATLTALIQELYAEVRNRLVGRTASVKHSLDVKTAAVIEFCTGQVSAQAIARKLAISRPTLYNRKSQLLGRAAPPFMKLQNDTNPPPERTKLQEQVESLQRGIRQLQLEHDI